MSGRRTTSFRFSPEALELIDAVAHHRGTRRVAVLERLLANIKPPDDLGATASRIRRAHTAYLASRNPDTPKDPETAP